MRVLKVLIACEFSGIVRSAFSARGHYAVSCDYLATEIPGFHYQGNVMDVLDCNWDLLIGHPPCTYLASSGARWWSDRQEQQKWALDFVQRLMEAPISRICIENPIGKISTAIRKPDQIIQPWQFGHGEVKTTCLWLKGLPLLTPTQIVEGREQKCWKASEHPDRWKLRSRTYQGIANAMAEQWGNL